ADRELGLNSQRNNLSFLMTEAGENRVPPRLERLVIRPRGTESQREFVRERFPGPKRVIRLTPRPLGWAARSRGISSQDAHAETGTIGLGGRDDASLVWRAA